MSDERRPLKTRFADMGRFQALGVLLVVAGALSWGLWVGLTVETIPTNPAQTGTEKPQGTDTDFYLAVVQRVHNGEPYYDVTAEELKKRGGSTSSMFNWRPPFFAWLIGYLPSPTWGKAILALGALLTLLFVFTTLERDSGVAAAGLAVLLLLNVFAWCLIQNWYLLQELWSATLMTVSIVAYANGRWRWAVLTGMLALFFRELALPYCGVAVGLAMWKKRWAELVAWAGGLAAYAIFLAYHAYETSSRIGSDGIIHASEWVRAARTEFVLLTTQINYFLLSVPGPAKIGACLSAVYLVLALLGLAGRRDEWSIRGGLAVAIYIAAFHFVGKMPHNSYWGLMYGPFLPFGIIWAPAACWDLYLAVVRPRLSEPV